MICTICNTTNATHIYTTSVARGYKGSVCLTCGVQCVKEDTQKGYRAKITLIK